MVGILRYDYRFAAGALATARVADRDIEPAGTDMTLSIRPLRPTFAGEVTGIDLRAPLSSDQVAAIEAGMDRYAVLVFPGQPINDEQQMAFTRNFGGLERAEGGNITRNDEYRLQTGMVDVSNLDKNGQPLERSDRRRMFNLGNRLWHSDSSFRAVPAKYSLLSARTVATRGGNTEFADMRAAYDALDEETRAMIADLICEHSLLYSRGSMGFTEFTDAERETFRPVRQRLVRTHPVTGRKSLYLSSHIGAIVGWPVPEARDFIRDLAEHATQREFVYAHIWKQYDFVIWDNRQTMHRVRRFDETQPRDMRRTTVAGDAMTAEQIPAEAH
jgi:alpha-ketoglutarate-dependent 2,4-dichlorophenoxyacetate dioxygenase